MAKGFSIEVEPKFVISKDVAELCLKMVQHYVNNSNSVVKLTNETDGTISYSLVDIAANTAAVAE